MTSSEITPVSLNIGNIVDGQSIEATDVTVPFIEAQNNLPANTGYFVSVSPDDTHKKHLADALEAGAGITLAIQNASGDEKILITGSGGGYPAEGRLTIVSNTPVSQSEDFTTAFYYTPYTGNRLALWSGSAWVIRTFNQITRDTTGLTESTVYDVFAYDNSGVVALELTAWSTQTARASALGRRDGVVVKASDHTRRYLGSIYTQVGPSFADNLTNRTVFNYYNRVDRTLSDYFVAGSNPISDESWYALSGVTVLSGVAEDDITAHIHIEVAESSHFRAGVALNNNSASIGPKMVIETAASTQGVLSVGYVGSLTGLYGLSSMIQAASDPSPGSYTVTSSQFMGKMRA